VFENWSPSERRGFGTAFGTVCLACLAWAFPNMSRIITIPGAIAAFGLTVYFLLPEIEYAASRITNPKGMPGFGVIVAALISFSIGLGWDGWYYANWLTQPALVQGSSLPPIPLPAPVAKGPAPIAEEAPCVTQGDIDAQKKLGRELLNYTPAEFINMYVDNPKRVEAYRRSWVKTCYPFNSLASETLDKKTYDVVILDGYWKKVYLGPVLAYFDPKKYGPAVRRFKPKDIVTAVCIFMGIVDVQNGIVTQHVVIAYDCELP
jgi:hypothetical protein